MAQTQPNHPLPGAEELRSWRKDWSERVLPHMSPEERLVGLTPKERLVGLTPKERIAGLTAEELAELKDLLSKS